MTTPHDRAGLLDISRALMVAHGAGLGILVSLIGPAMEHPALFNFITMPAASMALGFLAALYAYNVARFDAPPQEATLRFKRWAWLYLWLFVWVSGAALVISFITGGVGYISLVAASFPASL